MTSPGAAREDACEHFYKQIGLFKKNPSQCHFYWTTRHANNHWNDWKSEPNIGKQVWNCNII